MIAELQDARAYYGSGAMVAMIELLNALEKQYMHELVTAEPDRVIKKQAACQQVRALRDALMDKDGIVGPLI